MAIDFLNKKDKQTKMIIVLVVIVLITFIIIVKGFSGKNIDSPIIDPEIDGLEGDSGVYNSEININLTIFDNPIFDELEVFEKIKPLEGSPAGRENPFIPYY
jgi:hypothetical protein